MFQISLGNLEDAEQADTSEDGEAERGHDTGLREEDFKDGRDHDETIKAVEQRDKITLDGRREQESFLRSSDQDVKYAISEDGGNEDITQSIKIQIKLMGHLRSLVCAPPLSTGGSGYKLRLGPSAFSVPVLRERARGYHSRQ